MKEYIVYMLRCNDESYYTGVTSALEHRLAQHADGVDPHCYTFNRRPVELVHAKPFREVLDAIAREKQIKRWSRRKKEALIEEDVERLQHYSRRSHLSR